MIRELLPCQVHDPAKGSFLVNARPVKRADGNPKFRRCSDGIRRPVYRAPHYYNQHTGAATVRDDAVDFVVMT